MENSRIGVYICWCGSNIGKIIDVQTIAKSAGKLPNVVLARDYKYMCSDPGQESLIKDIKTHKLNRIVVAACSPRIHEATFRKALEKAGLNPYLLQMANIREQDSWVHINKEYASQKALSLVKAAIYRVPFHEALDKRYVEVNHATLIIGAGITGITAALEIANAGKQVFLIEKSKNLGGIGIQLDLGFTQMGNVNQFITQSIKQVLSHKLITVFAETYLEKINGYLGNFHTIIHHKGTEKELHFGNIILASGLNTFDPSRIPEYQYSKIPFVITSLEFEKMLSKGNLSIQEQTIPKNIALIHCVGSRNDKYHTYCSRICCETALKYANQIQSLQPDTNIYQIYSDMRCYSKGGEELYSETASKGVLFLLYDQNNGVPKIKKASKKDSCKMLVTFKEQLSSEIIEVPADLVVLMTAMEAHDDAKQVARLVGISVDKDNFYMEKHPKLDPVATTTDGVFIAGACQGPKSISESISQAKAATARVLSSISAGKMEVEVTTSKVNEDVCCACQTCISVCPYTAISFNDEKQVSTVNEVLCKGCGTCGSACPTGAIRTKHFTDKQILSQIEGLFINEKETN